LKDRHSPTVRLAYPRILLVALSLASGLFAEAQAEPAASTVTSTAESQGGGEIQEIIVTAQRRKENLQDVPITVQAFSDTQLLATGVTSSADLPMVTPGLVFGQQIGLAQPFLRGVGSVAVSPGLENPVATYVDDVYYGPLLGGVVNLANVDQVEVDKGPQGTLFGRNATGGLIQIKTKDPSQDFNGSVAVTYGNYKTVGSDIYLTGGVTSDLATDLAANFVDQGQGYGRNIVTGTDINRTQEVDLRNKWLFTPSRDTEIKLILDFERNKNSDAFATAPGTTPVGAPMHTVNPQNIAAYYQPFGTLNEWGASIHVRQGIDDVGQFISITAYRHVEEFNQGVATLAVDPSLAISATADEVHHQFSQEFQFASPEGSKINWVTGAYFFDSLSAWQPLTVTGGYVYPYAYILDTSDQRAVSGALYGQGTIEVLPATDLTVGARYTYERHSIVLGTIGATYPGYEEYAYSLKDTPDPISFEKPTWRLALDHHFTSDLMGYISYNRGFKSGGFNDIAFPANEFLPETLDAYEVGAKANLFGNRLQLNTSAFVYNYKNMQNSIYYAESEFIYNSAEAKMYGIDSEGKVGVTKDLAITASAEWLHTYYASFPNANISTPVPGGGTVYSMDPPLGAKGHHLPLAPDATVSIGVDYTVETGFGDIIFNVTDAYNSGWFGEPDNRLHQPSYNLLNTRISWDSTDKTDTVSFWGKNLTNVNYLTALASSPNGDYGVFAPPRTYGITVSKKF
jgi:iron complex outermembrane recepter protein